MHTHTLIIHPIDRRVYLPPQSKFKAVSPSIYFLFTYQFYTHTRTSTYAYTSMNSHISQRFYIFSQIKIFPNCVPQVSRTLNKLSFTSNKNYKKILYLILFGPHIIQTTCM